MRRDRGRSRSGAHAMTTLNTADLSANLRAVLDLVRRGESVLLHEDGVPVARIGPPAEPPADDELDGDDNRWWRGTFALEVPPTPAPGFVLPSEPVTLERRLPEI